MSLDTGLVDYKNWFARYRFDMTERFALLRYKRSLLRLG
jgi:hypothetical protein